MANVRETRKITVEEAPVPGATVPGETRTPNTPNSRPPSIIVEEAPRPGIVEEAISLQASPVLLPQIPDAASDAASDDGPPKADTFFTLAREHVGPALRCTIPILIYAVAVAAPALSVFVPLTREVILPVATGNVTLASMASASAHGYLEADGGLTAYLQFLFLSVLVVSFIKEHSTMKWWYSVIIMNVVNASIHTVSYHCGFYYSLNEGMVVLFLSAFCIVIQVPLNFGIVHIALQKNAAGSLWWHMPLCAFCFCIEMVNIVVIKNSTAYLQSDLFPWTAPFIFSLTAVFTRRAAEWSAVPPSEASKMSSISLGLGVFFTRMAQSALINNPEQVLVLEVFYAVLNIFLRVSLYQRHAILSLCSRSGTLKVRGAPRNPRAQSITTVSNVTEAIWDTIGFILLFLSRFLLLPSSITTTNFALVFCGCIALQILANTATILLVSYYEEIPIEDFFISWTSCGAFGRRWIYFWAGTTWAAVYLNLAILNVWDQSIRTLVPWK